MRVPQPTPPAGAAVPVGSPGAACTHAADGSSAADTASAIILSGSLIARFTPAATTGLPENRSRPLTPTSVAKMTASALAIVCAVSGVLPDEPCVSTESVTPARLAAAVNASAAMYVWAIPVGHAVTATSDFVAGAG